MLQSPSFVYLAELGTQGADGQYHLSGYELAAKLSLFLTGTAPDDLLWSAAEQGKLDDAASLEVEVERLLQKTEVQLNLDKALSRFFGLEGLPEVKKAVELTAFSPALAQSMYGELNRFIDDVVWKQTGSLDELLTSREAKVDPALAALYDVSHPTGSGVATVSLPESQRAGILTRAGLMTIKASQDETSTIFRGLLVTRGLLCALTPAPNPELLKLNDTIKAQVLSERGRAETRMAMADCKGCHGQFEPFGIAFENYDPVGQYRTSVTTAMGPYTVDASWKFDFLDIKGEVDDAVALSTQLAGSRAVRQCMAQNLAFYAVGQRLADADVCTTGDLYQRFEASGGNLRTLVKDIATWPGLRVRKETL